MNEDLIECVECGWQGDPSELVCSDKDGDDIDKPIEKISFNICPECGAVDCFEEFDDEDEL